MTPSPSSGGGPEARLPDDVREECLGILFLDLARFGAWAAAEADLRVAAFLQGFYRLAQEYLAPAGVRIVKFMGDAVLAVFPPEREDEAVRALTGLRKRVRDTASAFGFEAALHAKVHVGSVVAGTFGPPGLERFEVFGRAVNDAVRLAETVLRPADPASDRGADA